MDPSRRFIFNGHAVAIGGRIVRLGDGPAAQTVEDGFIDVPASALSVVGGRSTHTFDGEFLKRRSGRAASVVRVDRGETFVEGTFDDLNGRVAVSNHQGDLDDLTTTTRVNATVEGLSIGRAIELRFASLFAGLESRSSSTSGEPPIDIDRNTSFNGVSIVKDGREFPLTVTLNCAPFVEHNTHSKFMRAIDDLGFLKDLADQLGLTSAAATSRFPRLFKGEDGRAHASIVKSIDFQGAGVNGVRFDRNQIIIENWGRAFLGELLIGRYARRLTMVRAQLGSQDGGDVGGGDVGGGGTWS